MKKKKIYEGKAKIIFQGDKPNTLIQYFKDDATAFNNQKKGLIQGKGVINNLISELLMKRLGEINIPNHLIKRINMREQLVYNLEIIPLEIVVRNVAAGSLTKRLGIKEGKLLNRPLVEFYLKNDQLNDPLVSEEHIVTFGWASNDEIEEILSLSLRINDFLLGFFLSKKIRLIDLKLEFGKFWDGEESILMLGDEISPDNCRLWDLNTNKKLDKDRFREDLEEIDTAYKEVAHRLGVISEEQFKKTLKNEI
tara:strand:+ start:319 stop:1074 length:756 start_codon:yes stop_codon:yes gene_type:complete